MATTHSIILLATFAAAAMTACGGGGGDGEPAVGNGTGTASGCVAGSERLELVSGEGQTGAPVAVLAQRPTVRLSCKSMQGDTMMMAGASVDWRDQAGAGNLVDGRTQVTRRTAADGKSSVAWTLGQAHGSTMRIEAAHESLKAVFSASTSGTTTTARRCEDVGGTDHGAALTLVSATVWSAAGSPHRGGTVTLADSAALLSIEAGAVVCVDSIEASAGPSGWPGSVSALGTAQAPIRFIGTALRAGGLLAHVIGDNMPSVGTADHPVGSLTDSSFGWSKTRDPGLCAQVVVGDMGSGSGVTLNRVSIRGYGSAACAALALNRPENAWDYGSLPIEVRVQDSIGDGIAVAQILNTAMTIDFVNCQVSNSGRHGIVVAAHAKATTPWVGASGCNLFGNDGNAIVNLSAVSVSAISNWWGDPAGPQGPNGDGTRGAVDASQPLAARRVLDY